jgi:excinuclease UvrABC nuclease subunit
MVGRTSTVRRVSHALTGIGWEKSGAIDQAFRSVADMCEASPKDYEALPGFGRKLSKQVWAELHGQTENGRLE